MNKEELIKVKGGCSFKLSKVFFGLSKLIINLAKKTIFTI